jgi:predicted PurR-regulated permease PerM
MPSTFTVRASWAIAGCALVLVLTLHLLVALLAGLLVYELVHSLAPVLSKKLPEGRAKLIVVALLGIAVGSAVFLAALAVGTFFHGDSLAALANKMAEILENSRNSLPESLAVLLPDSVGAIKESAVRWLREHAKEVQGASKEVLTGLVHIIIGMVIGAMIALHEVSPFSQDKPLAAALKERARRLAEAFSRIVFAQIRIAAINAALTALYLAVCLPLIGVHLPLTKTMIAFTFVAGLLPVIGNLVSNTVIVVVSLSHSPQMAVSSLAFLVVVHKLEYFLNARIVGARISAAAWELLLAMLVMEAAFGLQGLVAAPIYYAYLKDEFAAAGMV